MSDARVVLASSHWTVRQADYRVPGYLIVDGRAEHTRLDELDDAARADLMRCLASAERIVRALCEPERVYTLRFGEMVPRLHFHVVPRTAQIAAAYAAEVDDEPPFNGARVVAWLWANHASLGVGDAELDAWVRAARALA